MSKRKGTTCTSSFDTTFSMGSLAIEANSLMNANSSGVSVVSWQLMITSLSMGAACSYQPRCVESYSNSTSLTKVQFVPSNEPGSLCTGLELTMTLITSSSLAKNAKIPCHQPPENQSHQSPHRNAPFRKWPVTSALMQDRTISFS